jgi:transcription initiation factor IIF auxiliary subunit
MPKARKMVSLNIEEASGVDHPAHLHEGWLVIKSDNLTSMDDLLSDLKQEKNKPDESLFQKGTEEEPMAQDDNVEVVSEAPATEEVGKAKKMTPEEMMEKIAALEEELELAKKKMKKMESGYKDDEMKKEDDVASLVKSAPEPLRKMLEDFEKSVSEANARAAQAEEVLKAERVARANEEAVEKAKAWKYLGLEADKVGPALRQLAELDADLAKSVEDALTSVNAQAESANIFAEIGKSASPTTGNAYDQLTSLAKSATESKKGLTFEQAFSEAVLGNPDLYKQYLSEKGAS